MRAILLTGVTTCLLAGEAGAQRSPAAVEAVIISLQADRNGTVVLFNAGSLDGVDTSWKGELVGVAGTFTLTSCAPKRCKAKSSATAKEIRKSAKKVRVWR